MAGGLWAAGVHAQTTELTRAGRAAQDAGDLARAGVLYRAAAQSADVREAAEGEYFLGALADDGLDFRTALTAYRASVARDPSSRYAARAVARIDDLNDHAEGNFGPLVALEAVRRNARRANDPRAIATLDREIQDFPPGRVRAEARLLVADAYFGRLDRPRDAAREFLALAGDSAATADLRDLAAERLVQARGKLSEESLAVRELTAIHANPDVLHTARVMARRVVLRHIAQVITAVMAVVGAVSLVRVVLGGKLRRMLNAWLRPLPLAHLAMLTVGGAVLARTYDGHEGTPFYALGSGALGVYFLATAWSLVGSVRPRARVGRALLCCAAVLSVAYLTMELIDPMMLEGINL